MHSRGRHGALLLAAVLVALLALAAAPVLAKSTHEYTGVSFGPGGPGVGSFGDPQALAVDSAGNVYVYDNAAGGSVYKFNAAGQPESFSASKTNVIGGVGHAGFPAVDELAVSAAGATKGDLYVANDSAVGIYSSQTGEKLGELNSGVQTSGGPWANPCGVAVDPKGDVYVGLETGGHVNRYAPAGAVAENKDYTSSLNGLPGESCNLAADAEENVYVTTWEHGPVTRYAPIEFGALTATGTEVDKTGSTIAVDPNGNDLYIDEQTQFAEYDLTAEPPSLLATSGAAGSPGALSGSFGIAANSSSGQVYAAQGNGTVEIFGPLVTLVEHTLTVTNEGSTGTGTVTSSPVGIDCGATCSAQFVQNTTATLTATPGPHSKFTGWSGPDAGSCGTASTCEVPIGTSNRAVTATFAFGTARWSLALTHHNAYGAQRSSCPGGHESLPGEPNCGVDPFTGSGTTFSRDSGGNEYRIAVTNTGDAPPTELVGVSDRLPAGIVVFGTVKSNIAQGWTCVVEASATAVTCTRPPEALAPGASYPPIVIHTWAHRDANSAANVVSVEGGGTATVTSSDPTTVTEAVPFGIHTFVTSVVESAGAPFTDAAGHPFAASAELVFNYTPAGIAGLTGAGGGPKSITVDLPPGFLGNPQTTAQCPLGVLATGPTIQCPLASAVGYVSIALGPGGGIVGGRASPFTPVILQEDNPVYALIASPGHPAQFGFRVNGAAVILTGSVRSDGDYGVTLSAQGIPDSPKLLASRFTFCGNGENVTAGAFGPTPRCNLLSAQPEAFLTNPAHCSSQAPTTTVRATPWNEPSTEVSKTVYTGVNLVGETPSPSESFLIGCSSGGLAERWTGATIALTPESTRADTPTGFAFGLATPQSTDATKPATPELKDTSVVLPAGMTVSPSAANGLQGCTDAQLGLRSSAPGDCPAASQIGTAAIFTPLLSASPVIEGVPRAGEALTCAEGSWDGSPSFAYRWLRDGIAIAGASGREYTPASGDEGKTIQCQVLASNASGSSAGVSRGVVVAVTVRNEEGEIESFNYEPGSPPPLQQSRLAPPTGSASVGGLLNCGTAAWKGEPALVYRWLHDGVAIPGAAAPQFTPTIADEGRAIQCELTATNPGGTVIADGEAAVVAPQGTSLPPLLGAPVQGRVFIGAPLCAPCSSQDAQEGHIFRLFIEAQAPERGVTVKLAGNVSADPATGRLTAVFKDNPQLPFEELGLAFKGGPRAPVATPQACGQAKTTSDLTPWSSEPVAGEPQGTPDALPSSAFTVDWDGHGAACPSGVPFAPAFLAQTASSTAGAFTPFTAEFSRGDREQDLGAVSVQTPPGLLGKIAGIPRCPEAQANAGSCSPESEIGTSTVQAGAGSEPLTVSGGRVYLTGRYRGQPFGLSIVVPAVAGPFNLGDVVVRASIAVDPATGQLTVVSDPLPQIQDGVPFRLRRVDVEVNRPGFIFNPTNCAAQQVTATLTGVPLNAGEASRSSRVSSPFAAGGCSKLPFKPMFAASTLGNGNFHGASLDVRISQRAGEAAIHGVDTQLPLVLPSRLATLQKACTESQFTANPAGCPAGSVVGFARAITPVLSAPLTGPAYLVSHGGAAFPDLDIVLQGEGVTILLTGSTDIKNGVTFSRFETVPDAPISSFELTLPGGPGAVLAATRNLCALTNTVIVTKHVTRRVRGHRKHVIVKVKKSIPEPLLMPTTITGQNGAVVRQTTRVAVTGCSKANPKRNAKKSRKGREHKRV
jgi:uncharacterized repeat protein (TIGR01451 family)